MMKRPDENTNVYEKKKRKEKLFFAPDRGSFTVEGAFVVPMVIMIIILAIHIGIQLKEDTVAMTQKPILVEGLNPVEEMYKRN